MNVWFTDSCFCAGVREVEPAMLWNPAVLAGVGVVEDHKQLYKRMHSYLQASGVDGVKVRACCNSGPVDAAHKTPSMLRCS